MQQYDAIRRSGAGSAAIDEGLRGYMNRVYGLMAVALAVGMGWAAGRLFALM